MDPIAKTLAVLIVEDEALLAMDLEAMVTDCGHRVIGEAASFDEVEALTIDAPDLVFLDMHLAKGSSGLDVAALIRERWTSAVIVFVTANPMKIPSDFAGAHGVIPKPFSRNGLMSAIRYLQQGMTAPPPSIPRPISFVPAPIIEARWSESEMT
ncbi:response regulator [uncultured Sphingomonas sp.]|uniref:response regulator n=1 Tax=uncultured Sphingomonas sp. TaxID=158754 RepID=UPI0035CB33BF